ncbi:MAG TPA: LacI family DNA-binding transcriptional regulator [Burkholderiaceae bacterium]|nr:LacI family DNA-binding transcriptional regulator [Burkholderiaceae bacterium]
MKPAKSPKVTIRDVATASGVHFSTVSRALDPARRKRISKEVLELVEETARRLGYQPNRAASALRTGRTHTIGVLVPDITNPVFPPILQGIEASAAARGYFVFVANVGDPQLARPILARMQAQQIDGLVMAIALRDDPLIDFVRDNGLHAVMVNRADESGRLPAAVSDDRLAMKLAVDHLAALGHRRIAHLAGPQNVPTGVGRRQGVEQAMHDHRLKPPRVVECESYSREAGLRVPQDISITGHNDMPLVDMVDPPLTTIRLPHRDLGWRAAEMLFDEIEGKSLSASTVVLRPELVVRASTAARATS